MANSLRAKIKKLKHDGHIDSALCEDLLLKLEGHDREVKVSAICDFADYCSCELGASDEDIYARECIREFRDKALAEMQKG